MTAKIVEQAAAAEPDSPSSEFDNLLRGSSSQAQPVETAPAHEAQAASDVQIEADVDGRRVRIVAKDEIVLECGNASITLRRNGRIVIKGTYVETCSEGTNRIKGGQVRIN